MSGISPASALAASMVIDLARKHGVTIDPAKPLKMLCPDCGKVPVPRPNQLCRACEDRASHARSLELIRRAWSSVPAALTLMAFDHPLLAKYVWDVEATAKAQAAAVTRRALVTLTGGSGAGKTTLAVCILRETARKGARKGATFVERRAAANVLFTTALDLVHARAAHPLGEDDPPLVVRAKRASVLVLDELGTASDPHRIVFAVLHYRHANVAPTVVTTWMSETEVDVELGGGIVRRLREDGVVIDVKKKEALT